MDYFTKEIQLDEGMFRTAGIKARDDIYDILKGGGFKAVDVIFEPEEGRPGGILKRLTFHGKVKKEWDRRLSHLKKGDRLLIQFPVINHSLLFFKSVRKLKKRGVTIFLLIHDLESFMAALRKDRPLKKRIRMWLEERTLLFACDRLIVHTPQMAERLASLGYDRKKTVSLDIFDYLIPDYEEKKDLLKENIKKEFPVILAGTLRPHKAKYSYDLPGDCAFNLYGVGYEGEERDNVSYFGSFPTEELPYSMKGSFGLVWDGERCDTCGGIYGEYLRINAPHKTSLYLAVGIPVIIWEEAALASYVTRHRCGITVKSLYEISGILKKMTEEEYRELKQGAEEVGVKLRAGYHTLASVE